jgi:hypothetical protein
VISINNYQGNASEKPQLDITSYLSGWLLSKRQEVTSVRMWTKGNTCALLVGM